MKIAFDLKPVLTNKYSGFYTYGVGLLTGLERLESQPNLSLFYSKRFSKQANEIENRIGDWAQSFPTAIKLRWLEKFWQYSSIPPLQWFTGEFDIYHCFHHLMPPTKCAKRIMTIHDLRRYTLSNLYSNSSTTHFEIAIKRADHFIAVSESTKNDLCAMFHIPHEKVDVIHLAANQSLKPMSPDEIANTKEKLAKQVGENLDQFIITFSSSDTRKNITRTIEAFHLAKQSLPSTLKLVVIGKLPKNEDFSTVSDDIIFTGTVDIIEEWLCCAQAMVFASLYEGFGIPILEAFACGIPVITSNISSMPEVAGDNALLVDPNDASDIAKAIVKMCSDDSFRRHFIETGISRNRKFNWPRVATETVDVYKKVLG